MNQKNIKYYYAIVLLLLSFLVILVLYHIQQADTIPFKLKQIPELNINNPRDQIGNIKTIFPYGMTQPFIWFTYVLLAYLIFIFAYIRHRKPRPFTPEYQVIYTRSLFDTLKSLLWLMIIIRIFIFVVFNTENGSFYSIFELCSFLFPLSAVICFLWYIFLYYTGIVVARFVLNYRIVLNKE